MNPLIRSQSNKYENPFLVDMQQLFMGTNSGHIGKYLYDDENWGRVVEFSEDYYVPRAERQLIEAAAADLPLYIPQGTPLIDFGTIMHSQDIILDAVKPEAYYAVDFCKNVLSAVKTISCKSRMKISTVQMDFFKPITPVVSRVPALGIMNGLAITNVYGTVNDLHVDLNLIHGLKTLGRLTGQGWLMATIDTNQDETSLKKMYDTPLNSRLFLHAFNMLASYSAIKGFDPNLFAFAPRWLPELQLFAHVAEATETQSFMFKDARMTIRKGEQFHIMNSYKYSQEFFEKCCDKSGHEILRRWDHDTPIKLYLMKVQDSRKQRFSVM